MCDSSTKLSEYWQDDKRMNSLFLPFRKKELNPVDWESKMKFWQNAIENWAFEKNECLISVKKLEKEFKRNEKSPRCLSTVLDHLASNGEIKRKEDFLSFTTNESWTKWAVNSLVKGPVFWSFSKLKGAFIELDASETQYVHLNLLKIRGDKLLSIVKTNKKSLMSLKDVDHAFKEEGIEMPSEGQQLVLNWLQVQKRVVLMDFEDRTLVKFSSDCDSPAKVSEADMALFSLKQNKIALVKNLEALEIEKMEAVEEAKDYLRKGMRHSAKSSLRKKKELEKCIAKRSSALDNIEVLLSSIHEAESDTKLVEAYRMGLSALKATFKNAGLTEDSVISTMDEVHEAIDIHEEIQSALSQTIEPVIDDELEKELAGLMSQPEKQPSFIVDLPDVPDHDLDTIIAEVKKINLMSPTE